MTVAIRWKDQYLLRSGRWNKSFSKTDPPRVFSSPKSAWAYVDNSKTLHDGEELWLSPIQLPKRRP
jgi:hypothetical protein